MRNLMGFRSCTAGMVALLMASPFDSPLTAQSKNDQASQIVESRSYNLKPGMRDRPALEGLRRTGRAAPAVKEHAMQTETASDLTTLLDLNRDYVRSVQTSNVQRFREILADDFLCSNPDGSLVDKKRFLEQTALPVTISNLEVHDVNVRIMGDVAIIHARTTYTAADGRAGSGRYTDVWAKRNGTWLAVSAHVTRL